MNYNLIIDLRIYTAKNIIYKKKSYPYRGSHIIETYNSYFMGKPIKMYFFREGGPLGLGGR